SLDKIADEYKFPCQTEPCSAIMGSGEKIDKSIKKGLNWLLHTIAEDFDALNERIQRDMAEEKAYEEQQKPERAEIPKRAEIVRRLREEARASEDATASEDARASEEDRHVPGEEDAEPVNNENPFQPPAAVISKNEKEIEKDKQQQNVETEKATTVLDLQTEEEHMDAQHLPSGSNQTANESRPETCESATTQLLQPEEGNEQTTLACLPSGNRKKRNRLQLRRSHGVVPITAEATVPRHLTPPAALPTVAWGSPRLNRLQEIKSLGEPHHPNLYRKPLPPLTIHQRPNSDTHDAAAKLN
ncbi:PREDICTED: ADP-ribosylation factor-like protein 13B, partial [Eurypyga helias]|uniref:ADP-ribosylation factor-like protein 13B n=1 Tax=Eurypyga helias TaxID=54383 RepID=UPI0005287DBE